MSHHHHHHQHQHHHQQQQQHQQQHQQQQQQQHQHQKRQRQQPLGVKKVEWSSTLTSSEPQQQQQMTENGSPMWDCETDHNILSYFLDGNGVASPSPPSNADGGSTTYVSDRILQHPFRTDNFPGSSPGQRSMAAMRQDQLLGDFNNNKNSHSTENDNANDLRQPPPTPVVQHYFHSSSSSSSSRKKSSKPVSSSNPGSSTISSGTLMPRQTNLFPFNRQQQQQQQQQQVDSIQEMKRNFMGAYHQQFTPNAGNNNNSNSKNHYVFQGYNASMETSNRPISPALEFGRDHEPLLLPGQGGVPIPTQPHIKHHQQRQLHTTSHHSGFSSQIHSLAATSNETSPSNTYGISSGNPTNVPSVATAVTTANNNSSMQIQMHPAVLNTGQASVGSSQHAAPAFPPQAQSYCSQAAVAAQTHFAQPIQSSSDLAPTNNSNTPNHPTATSASTVVVGGGFPQAVIGGPPTIHPSAVSSAALVTGVGGNQQFFFPHHLTAAYLMQKTESPEETEEKRAKRLERNRESARKSRRRKKERLSSMEGKVSKLFGKIEHQRRVQINSMGNAWNTFQKEELIELKELHATFHGDQEQQYPTDTTDRREWLRNGLSRLFMSEKEQSTRKEIVEFQFNSLAQHLLPRYQKFLLWLILQNESYFLSGKEEHATRELSNKITTGKISSKQLGEEISSNNINNNTSVCVSESEKFWPLVCFELSISVEQEERFLELQGKWRQAEMLHRNISQIVAATRLISSAKECVRYQLYLSAFRKRKTYNDILTPKQAILYQEWLLSNKDRVENIVSERRKKSSVALAIKRGRFISHGERNEDDRTLEKLCHYLEESLKISKNLPGSLNDE